MFIGALIDAGADPSRLQDELKKLRIEEEYELTWNKVVKNGITSTKFDVLLTGETSKHKHAHQHGHSPGHGHSHDHADHVHTHSHGHDHSHSHSNSHHHAHSGSHEHAEHTDHVHAHDHSHSPAHHHGHHHHDHRSYKDIVKMIEHAGFEQPVQDIALRIFKKIGGAEGHIHGVPLEKVHFHEVGAVDSIIDIVGAAILIHQLEIDMIQSSPVPVGRGKIRIDHGIYPVPAPATLEILRGAPLEQSDIRGELTTPTGAAIVSVLAEAYGPIPSMRVRSIGYGAGTKTFAEHPNVLRVIIGD